MIKFLKVSTVLLGASLAVGCAGTTEFDKLQSQIDSLAAQTAAITAQTEALSAQADSAASDARAAADSANRAAASAAETNQKLDRMLNKAMMK